MGLIVVNGYGATFGEAFVNFDNNVDFPAFGYPTNPTSEINFNSNQTVFSSPSVPSVNCLGLY